MLPLAIDVLPEFQIFLNELELEMEKLYQLLCEKVGATGIIEFYILIKDKPRLEAINTFILLLFLAQSNKVNLWQNEETEELFIVLGELEIGKEQTTFS